MNSCYYRLSLAYSLEMYSKFMLPNWNLLSHMFGLENNLWQIILLSSAFRKCINLFLYRSTGFPSSPDEKGETTLDAMIMDG